MGRPKMNKIALTGRVSEGVFQALKNDAMRLGYVAFKGTQSESPAWGEYLTAIATGVISGDLEISKNEG